MKSYRCKVTACSEKEALLLGIKRLETSGLNRRNYGQAVIEEIAVEGSDTKRCSKCRQILPKSQFYRAGDKLASWCKDCKNIGSRVYRAKQRMHNLKARNMSPRMLGEKSPSAKLTAEDVRLIRLLCRDGVPASVVAEKFEISSSTVKDIRNYKKWAHIE